MFARFSSTWGLVGWWIGFLLVFIWLIGRLIKILFRFASVIVNLGPTFLSGALAANAGTHLLESSNVNSDCLTSLQGELQSINNTFLQAHSWMSPAVPLFRCFEFCTLNIYHYFRLSSFLKIVSLIFTSLFPYFISPLYYFFESHYISFLSLMITLIKK